MATLSKVFDDLFAVSQGDVATLNRATEEFVLDVTRENRIPRQPAPPVEVPSAAPSTKTREEGAE